MPCPFTGPAAPCSGVPGVLACVEHGLVGGLWDGTLAQKPDGSPFALKGISATRGTR